MAMGANTVSNLWFAAPSLNHRWGIVAYRFSENSGQITGGFGFRLASGLLDALIDQCGNSFLVFAVDGGASAKDFRSQVGDSFIITEDGHEQITHHSKAIEDLIIN